MKSGYFKGLLVVAAAVSGLLLPGCGDNKNNANTLNPYGYPPGAQCIPGQPCTNPYGGAGGAGGVLAQSTSALSTNGSFMVLTFAAAAVSGGYGYQGPVTATGTIHLNPGDCTVMGYGGLQQVVGDFQVQGQGYWNGSTGLAFVQQLQMQMSAGGTVYVSSGQVNGGPCLTPGAPSSGTCMTGVIQVPLCQRSFVSY